MMEDKYSVTEGKLLPSFIMFTLPLFAASILQQSYSVADGLILGNAISQEALGAVSSCDSIINASILIQIGLAGGCSILASHMYGANRFDELNKLISDMRRIVLSISVVIMLAVFVFTSSILRILHTPESIIDGAAAYMRIVFLGVPFMSMYNLQAGILRGMGDSRRPLGGIAISSGVNILLDLIFVVAANLGISGAAIATVTAEALSAFYLYVKLNARKGAMPAGESTGDAEIAKANVKECVGLSIPQMIESTVFSAGNILLQNITNILGVLVVIGVSVAFKIDTILYIPLFSLGISVGVFVGQNTGAGRPDRVREALKCGTGISISFALILSLILWKIGMPLFDLFGLDVDAARVGYRYLQICLPFYWVFGLQFIMNGFLNGSKHTAITSGAAIIGLAGRLALAYFGYKSIGSDVLPMAEVLSWVIALICTSVAAIVIHIKEKRKAV